MAAVGRGHRIKALAVGGTADHVHMLLSLPATMPVAKAIQLVKGNSSRWLRDTFEHMDDFAWQEGYSAFSVHMSLLDATIRYITSQPEHHRKTAFEDEYTTFLKTHRIAFDEKSLWD